MDFNYLRFYVKTRWLLGISAVAISTELVNAYGSEAPSYGFITKWIRLFNEGREQVEDIPRSGRPRTSLTSENIDLVRSIIEDNPYTTYDEIEALTSLHPPTIYTILHEHLRLRKVCSRYVPYELTEKMKKQRVSICQENLAKIKEGKLRLCDIVTGDESWFYHRKIGTKQSNKSWIGENESPRTVVKRGNFEPKTLFCIFFRTTGPISITYFDKGQSVDSDTYITYCLKPMLQAINEQRSKSGIQKIKLHHDNARPHVSKDVISYINEQGIKLMSHPPYSPDLAPADFWLFDRIKQQLDSHQNAESLCDQMTKVLEDIPHEEFLKTFHVWQERMELCIKYKGEYFEHYLK